VIDQRVLFFGDSHVAGVGDPSGLGWDSRVVAASFAAGTTLTAYNLGVRGDTSVHVAARWRQETRVRLVPGAETRIVMSFGANDTTIEDGVQRVDAERSCDALGDMLARASAIGLPALVVGPAPVDDAEQNRRIQSLSVAFGEICASHAVPFLGVVEPLLGSDVWREQVASGDGAHPGAAGYEALAQLVLAGGWLDWLADQRTPVSDQPPARR
jgi:acyl-CoA thioesterase I